MARPPDVSLDSGGKRQPEEAERAIAALAGQQHGVVSRTQLVDLGLGTKAVEYRLRIGRLHPIHRGVYAVGHRLLTFHGRCMAAVLAAGAGAVLSHRSAAALWDIGRRSEAAVDVSAPKQRRPQRGLRIHQATLPPDEVTTHDGIPTTTVTRTLLDLAATTDRHTTRRAAERAEALRLTSPLSLVDLLTRYPGRAGTATLRAITNDATPAALTRSELEDAFLAFIDETNLPRPQVNATVHGHELDMAWPPHRLAVELDSRTWHDTDGAFERDRERDRVLLAAGWRTVRVTHRHLHPGRARLRSDLEALLGRAAA